MRQRLKRYMGVCDVESGGRTFQGEGISSIEVKRYIKEASVARSMGRDCKDLR